MSISIIIVCLLIVFNFVDIANKITNLDKPQEISKQGKISGHIVFNLSNLSFSEDKNINSEELRSLKIKTFFYVIVVVVAIIIINLLIILILLFKGRREYEKAGN